MRRVLIALLFVTAASAWAQPTIRCESADNRYRECEVDGVGRIALSRQLSDFDCVEGKTWGYRDGMVWVDKGCRGEFTLVERGFSNRRGGRIVVCESEDGERETCPTNTRGGVALVRKLSRASCLQGRSWGYTREAIWVDEGCRGEFSVGSGSGARGRPSERLDELVICESRGGRNSCPADTRSGVQLVRQISKSSCRFGRDWGYERDGIWVDNGCGAEFAVASNGRGGSSSSSYDRILCESRDGRRTYCRADTSRGVELQRQISDGECMRNRTWGFDRDGIWVSGGCRAEFRLGRGRGGGGRDRDDDWQDSNNTIVCESRDGRRAFCQADTRGGVRLGRRLSEADCVRNQSWGYDRNGIWVDDGCRAEFLLEDRR